MAPQPALSSFLTVFYCVWAAVAIGLSFALAGLTPETVTRVMVLAFLLAQLALRGRLLAAFPRWPPRVRFVFMATVLAGVVEGFHMISRPVFASLLVDPNTSAVEAATRFGLDLVFTVPAYLVIFSVIWFFANRYRYTPWQFTFIMGLGQALGDGGLVFFVAAPAMLLFLPYPPQYPGCRGDETATDLDDGTTDEVGDDEGGDGQPYPRPAARRPGVHPHVPRHPGVHPHMYPGIPWYMWKSCSCSVEAAWRLFRIFAVGSATLYAGESFGHGMRMEAERWTGSTPA